VGSDSQVEFAYNDSLNMSTRNSPFQIVYGINLRGVSKLIYLEHNEFRSARAEEFVAKMHKLHNQIKEQFHNSSREHKHRVDQHRRELQFEVGEQVLAHLRKERFLGTYNKLKMKKI
jgi:hypothetical protein